MSRPSFTDEEALAFHAGDKPGKLEVVPTKPMATQRELSLAYSPGWGVRVLGLAVAWAPPRLPRGAGIRESLCSCPYFFCVVSERSSPVKREVGREMGVRGRFNELR